MSRVVVIDALNMFIRNYIVNPMISTNGNPIGGTVGFLNSVKKLMREARPDQVIICWDGSGGSQKRRTVVKEYKQGRKPLRKNYKIEGMSEQSEKENMVWQQRILMEMLNEMPIMQLVLDRVEADDIIAMVTQSPKYKGWEKVIVSSDKDFLQLLDGETVLYRPIQKKAWTKSTVIEEYGISPENFVIARAIAGDKSDNLAGIKGAGLPTIAKRLDFLCEDKMHTLDSVYSHCANADSKLKFFERIVEGWETVELNYKVMNLTPPSISVQGRQKINYALDNFEFELNATELKKSSVEHGFGSYDWTELMAMLRGMVEKNKEAA
jgi:5'-3' exonuclease|tara:strand:+ start:2809 stop:3777 length:969 start_codon:yes stop_codon:yes gene_type:complete